jgi:hypothetical protein
MFSAAAKARAHQAVHIPSAYTKFDPDSLKPGIGGMLFAFLATNITFV